MTNKEFESFVVNNARMPLDEKNFIYSFVGLAGETGEVMEWLKKTKLRSKPSKMTTEDLKNELGDVLHYIVRICRYYDWSLTDLMNANVEKLNIRYAGKV